jgi:hypothetical protein
MYCTYSVLKCVTVKVTAIITKKMKLDLTRLNE